MAEIYNRGSVTLTFNVYEDFRNYKSGMVLYNQTLLDIVIYILWSASIICVGVYKYTYGRFLGRHAVKVFGWGVENNVPYW